MSATITQFEADAINNASQALQNNQVGSKLKTILDQLANDVQPWTAQSYAINSEVVYGGIVYWSNAATTASDVPGVSSKWVTSATGAYPDAIKSQGVAGTINLTSADQGFITTSVAGVTFNLPSTASDGATYKFVGGLNTFTVVAPTGSISSLPNTFKVSLGMQVTLVAANVAGPLLYWNVVIPQGASAYDSTINYVVGNLVTSGGALYMAIQGTNVGNAPASSPTYWYKLSTSIADAKQIASAHVRFDGTGANPITAAGAYGISGTITKSGTGVYVVTFTDAQSATATIQISACSATVPRLFFHAFSGGTTLTLNTTDIAGVAADADSISVTVFPT